MRKIEKYVHADVCASVKRLYEAKKEYKKIETWYKEIRDKEQKVLNAFMLSYCEKGENDFSVVLKEGADYYRNHKKIKVQKIVRKSIVWDVAKIREKVGKALAEKFINRTYEITDYVGIVQMLYKYGVPPNSFKKYVRAIDTIDEKKLNQLSEMGELKKKDLVGCYKLVEGESYFRVMEVEEDDKKV